MENVLFKKLLRELSLFNKSFCHHHEGGREALLLMGQSETYYSEETQQQTLILSSPLIFSSPIFSSMSDTLLEGCSIALAFLVVGCMGAIMCYLMNAIYVLSYILVQLIVGDGDTDDLNKTAAASSRRRKQMIYYDLILDQIFLYRFWKHYFIMFSKLINYGSKTSSSSSKYNVSSTSSTSKLVERKLCR